MSHIADIEYVDFGPGEGEPGDENTIVCLHGIGGDHDSFKPQYQKLSDQFRILSWNMPGYRGSTALAELGFDTLSNRFIRWLDALEIGSAHLMGQSIGGMLAQELALRHPKRIRSLILVATTSAFGGRDDSFKEKFLRARLAPLDQGETMSDLAARFVPEIVGSSAPALAIEEATKSMAAVPQATYRQIMQCLITFNRREEWPNLALPVCLIAGEEDSNAPARTMEKMAEVLKQKNRATVEYHGIPCAGHLVNLEQPDACNPIIRHFLTA